MSEMQEIMFFRELPKIDMRHGGKRNELYGELRAAMMLLSKDGNMALSTVFDNKKAAALASRIAHRGSNAAVTPPIGFRFKTSYSKVEGENDKYRLYVYLEEVKNG